MLWKMLSERVATVCFAALGCWHLRWEGGCGECWGGYRAGHLQKGMTQNVNAIKLYKFAYLRINFTLNGYFKIQIN